MPYVFGTLPTHPQNRYGRISIWKFFNVPRVDWGGFPTPLVASESFLDTVDGTNPANQLRLVVEIPLFTRFYISQGGWPWDF